jgi:carboxyl-terminal processing protease
VLPREGDIVKKASPIFGSRTELGPRPFVRYAALAAVATAVAAPLFSQAAPEPTRRELLERDGIIWGTKAAWITPFEDNIREDLKIAGLARFWMEAKMNFPRFSRVPDLDWDKTFIDFLPRVRATASTHAYYKVLQELAALLQDAHTEVFLPAELKERMEAEPPIRLELIEDRVFVAAVDPSLARAGLLPGLEILKVDGIPVRDYADRFRRPYVGSNTAAHRELTIFCHGLLAGPKDAPVALELRDGSGRLSTRIVPRGNSGSPKPAPFERRSLPGKIAYLALNTFDDEGVIEQFEEALPELRGSDGIVLDVRENEGGSGEIAFNIIGDLSDKDFDTPAWRSREYIATLRAWGTAGGWYEPKPRKWSARKGAAATVPVVLLTGPRSLSATDVFAEVFQKIGRRRIVSEPTGGGTGDPLSFAVPGGGAGRVSTSGDGPGGIVGIGVVPDVLVKRTAADYLARRDAALEAGITELRRMIKERRGGA